MTWNNAMEFGVEKCAVLMKKGNMANSNRIVLPDKIMKGPKQLQIFRSNAGRLNKTP